MQTKKECHYTKKNSESQKFVIFKPILFNLSSCVRLLGASTSSNVIGKQLSSAFWKLDLLFPLRIFYSHLKEAHDSESK